MSQWSRGELYRLDQHGTWRRLGRIACRLCDGTYEDEQVPPGGTHVTLPQDVPIEIGNRVVVGGRTLEIMRLEPRIPGDRLRVVFVVEVVGRMLITSWWE
jgi:hypothetical protein